MTAEPETLGLILRSLAFAARKHRDQRRKDAEASPYINHPIALADILVNEGGVTDPVVICAALLHDTIEDTQTTKAELEGAFGPAIAAVVQEATDDKSLPKAERKRLQIEHAPRCSPEAKLVKLADKIANSISPAPPPAGLWSANGLFRVGETGPDDCVASIRSSKPRVDARYAQRARIG
jgi:guanosine-3',5'-bis(diphosphate) 3'-pyrophosphohydrolase